MATLSAYEAFVRPEPTRRRPPGKPSLQYMARRRDKMRHMGLIGPEPPTPIEKAGIAADVRAQEEQYAIDAEAREDKRQRQTVQDERDWKAGEAALERTSREKMAEGRRPTAKTDAWGRPSSAARPTGITTPEPPTAAKPWVDPGTAIAGRGGEERLEDVSTSLERMRGGAMPYGDLPQTPEPPHPIEAAIADQFGVSVKEVQRLRAAGYDPEGIHDYLTDRAEAAAEKAEADRETAETGRAQEMYGALRGPGREEFFGPGGPPEEYVDPQGAQDWLRARERRVPEPPEIKETPEQRLARQKELKAAPGPIQPPKLTIPEKIKATETSEDIARWRADPKSLQSAKSYGAKKPPAAKIQALRKMSEDSPMELRKGIEEFMAQGDYAQAAILNDALLQLRWFTPIAPWEFWRD